jgi:hypothetical protein
MAQHAITFEGDTLDDPLIHDELRRLELLPTPWQPVPVIDVRLARLDAFLTKSNRAPNPPPHLRRVSASLGALFAVDYAMSSLGAVLDWGGEHYAFSADLERYLRNVRAWQFVVLEVMFAVARNGGHADMQRLGFTERTCVTSGRTNVALLAHERQAAAHAGARLLALRLGVLETAVESACRELSVQ